jgi:hypothetical protein
MANLHPLLLIPASFAAAASVTVTLRRPSVKRSGS